MRLMRDLLFSFACSYDGLMHSWVRGFRVQQPELGTSETISLSLAIIQFSQAHLRGLDMTW